MAINYTNLTTPLGKYIKHINSYDTVISDIDTDRNDIETVLNTGGVIHLGDQVNTMFNGFQNAVTGWINVLKGRMDEIILDRDLVVNELPLGATVSIDMVLKELHKDMVANSEDVLESSVSVGSATTSSTNTNVGALATTTTLDGTTPPHPGAMVIPGNSGSTSQMARTSDKIVFTCIADSETGGATEGQELFRMEGGPQTLPYMDQAEQSGDGGTVTVKSVAGTSLVPNGSFDDWANDAAPDSWTATAGSYTTDYIRDSSDAFRGGNSMKFPASGGTLTLQTTIPAGNMMRDKTYLLCFWYKRPATGTKPTGTITVKDGASALVTSDNFSGLADSSGWSLVSKAWVCPKEISATELTVEIALTAGGTTQDFLLEDVSVVVPDWFNGVGYALMSGPDKFIVEDRISHTVTNDNAGVWQTAFRKLYGIQLPTVSSSPSIAEALAT